MIERRMSAGSDDSEEAERRLYTNWNYNSDLEIVDDHIDNGVRCAESYEGSAAAASLLHIETAVP